MERSCAHAFALPWQLGPQTQAVCMAFPDVRVLLCRSRSFCPDCPFLCQRTPVRSARVLVREASGSRGPYLEVVVWHCGIEPFTLEVLWWVPV